MRLNVAVSCMACPPILRSLRVLTLLGMLVAASASGQGWVYFANYLPGTLNEPVSGCSGLLLGSGYTAQLFAGPAGTPDNNLLALTPVTSFRTDPSQAGRIISVSVVVPTVAAGQVARLQMRVWDNRGGTITSWLAASSNPTVQVGASIAFDSPPLTPQNTSEPVVLTGLRSFSICQTHLSAPIPVGNSVYSMNLTGVPGRGYVIEAGTNLVHWLPLFTLTNISSSLTFNVTNAPPVRARFYRARVAP